MADKGKARVYANFAPSTAAAPSNERPELPSGEIKAVSGGVLTFSFLGNKCYAASSYPHPTDESRRKNANDSRHIVLFASPQLLILCGAFS